MPDVTGEVNFPEATEALKTVAEESRAIRANLQQINENLILILEELGKIARK